MFVHQQETDPQLDRSGFSSSSDSSNEWDFTSHSIASATGRPALRRGNSVPINHGSARISRGVSEHNSWDDMEKSDANMPGNTGTVPRTMLRRSHSVNTDGTMNSQYSDTLSAARTSAHRGISRHRSLNVAVPSMRMQREQVKSVSSVGPGIEGSMPRKKPMRGIHRSHSTGCDSYIYTSSGKHRLDLSQGRTERSGRFSMHKSKSEIGAVDENNKLALEALSHDSDSEDYGVAVASVLSGGSGGSGSLFSSPTESNSPTRPPLARSGPPPVTSAAVSMTKLKSSFFKKEAGASHGVMSTDDYEDGGLIVSGDACLVDSFDEDEEPHKSAPATASTLTSSTGSGSAGTPRDPTPRSTADSKHLSPFTTVLKILKDAHLSGTFSDLSDNESDNRTYSELFVDVVKPTMQHVRDLMMADFDSQLMEIQEKRKLKAKLEQLQSTNTKQNQKVMATLGTLEALDKHESALRQQREMNKDILTVLIAAMTALDVASKGDLTNIFATTLAAYVDEETEDQEEDEEDVENEG
jgi:peroxiredoxin family protein